MKLTRAQREALHVLVKIAELPGHRRVEGSKRRSELTPRPNVNYLAADALVRKGLARCIDPEMERGYILDSGVSRGMLCEYKYEVTGAGVAVHGEQ